MAQPTIPPRDKTSESRARHALLAGLGLYQVIGGAVGAMGVARAWPAVMQVSTPEAWAQTRVALSVSFGFFVSVAVAGVLCTRATKGWALMTWFAQGAQLVWFAGPHGSFYFAAGVVVGGAVRAERFVPILDVDFSFIASIQPITGPIVFGFNAAAACLLLLTVVVVKRGGAHDSR